ncbi:N-acetyl-gamma-glutamyl-phosphate reductase [Fodinicola feengrottensis]|uniref:N-acetyl-gamma-glutamyl-phosphate reductase n=1 Tax=Fodinicola feengrottensis TaxID=435914 RepID=A0ABP4SPA6_9ACTN
MIRAAIVGGSGYIGGELLRLLLCHPNIEVTQASSDRLRGQRVDTAHPNLRGRTDLAFCGRDELADSDVLLFATPHRATMDLLPKLADSARHVIDLSADFRLRDPWLYQQHYGVMHSAPELIDDFVPGLPELGHREALRTADRISVPGCMATAAILALAPIADLVEPEVTVDARTGSSGSGASASTADSHPQRSGAMRVFAPTGHRHEAEIGQATGLSARMTATGVEAVRGVQVVCQAQARNPLTELDLRRAYRAFYGTEPFVRVVAHRRGAFRYPDPKVLLGSNYCDVGFAVDGRRVTAMGALDNLVKGGAGAAVQCLNIRMGWPETLGLDFPGLHPI